MGTYKFSVVWRCATLLQVEPMPNRLCTDVAAAYYGEYRTYSASVIAVGQGPGSFAGNITFVCGTTVLAEAPLVPTTALQARKLGCSHTLLGRCWSLKSWANDASSLMLDRCHPTSLQLPFRCASRWQCISAVTSNSNISAGHTIMPLR